jgi:hypothetical protein
VQWDRRHNVARIDVSYAPRIWHRREIGDDLILGYNAAGRLARIVVRDPARLLPDARSERDALTAVHDMLDGRVRPADLDVVRSALGRARHDA